MNPTYYGPMGMFYDWFDWVAGVIVVGGALLTIVSLLGIVGLLILVLVPWRRGGTPRCGHCGYPVRGVENWTCPECGADYRQQGILAPHFGRRVHPLIGIPLFSFFLISPAIVLTILGMALGPQQETHTDNIDIDPIQATGFNQLQLYTYTAPGGPRHNPERFELHIDMHNDWHQFNIDLHHMTYTDAYLTVGPASPTPIDRAAIDQLFKSVGVDTTQAAFNDQADELWSIIQTAAGGNLRSTQPRHFTVVYNDTWSEDAPALWWAAVQAMIWVVIWLIGVAVLIAANITQRARQHRAT